jgi:hypothetical protein
MLSREFTVAVKINGDDGYAKLRKHEMPHIIMSASIKAQPNFNTPDGFLSGKGMGECEGCLGVPSMWKCLGHNAIRCVSFFSPEKRGTS